MKIQEGLSSLIIIHSLLGDKYDFSFKGRFNKVYLSSRKKDFIVIKKRILSRKIELTMRFNQPWQIFTFGFGGSRLYDKNGIREEKLNFEIYSTKRRTRLIFKTEDGCIDFLNYVFNKI